MPLPFQAHPDTLEELQGQVRPDAAEDVLGGYILHLARLDTLDGDGIGTDRRGDMPEIEVYFPRRDAIHHAVDVAFLGKGELLVRSDQGDAIVAISQGNRRLARHIPRPENQQVLPVIFVRIGNILADPRSMFIFPLHPQLPGVARHADREEDAAGEIFALVGRDFEPVLVALPLNIFDGFVLADMGGDAQFNNLLVPFLQQLFLRTFLAEQSRLVDLVEGLHIEGLVPGHVADELGRAL